MPSRADQLCVPERRRDRAAWMDENLSELLRGVPLMGDGWGGVTRLERTIFPPRVSGFLGGPLDPTCPTCGVETDEGTVVRMGELFRVTYQTCGCIYDWTEAELRARVKPSARES